MNKTSYTNLAKVWQFVEDRAFSRQSPDLNEVRTALLHIIESREDVWQEAQGRAEEVAQMFQLPEGMPDVDELDMNSTYCYGYPEPTGKDFLYPFGGNPQLCLDEA